MVHCATTTEGSKGMLFTWNVCSSTHATCVGVAQEPIGKGNCSACALSCCQHSRAVWVWHRDPLRKQSYSACALSCCQRSLAVLLEAPPTAGNKLAHIGGVDVGASRCRNCIVGLRIEAQSIVSLCLPVAKAPGSQIHNMDRIEQQRGQCHF